MIVILKKYWFVIGIIAIFLLTIIDASETAAVLGKWLKNHAGPEVTIICIFLISGLMLDVSQIKSGMTDLCTISLALGNIFMIAPLVAAIFAFIPLHLELKIGIFLLAVMPTTLSSGVVMTTAAGGNTANALLITILANGICVFTIPVTLPLLLTLTDSVQSVSINKMAIMSQLGGLVLIPLTLGLLLKQLITVSSGKWRMRLQTANQLLVLGIVWMAIASSRQALLQNITVFGLIFILAVMFHGILWLAAALAAHFFRLERGRKESVFFMGGQKTLPLAIILQVTLFPGFGLALVFNVIHHVVHLIMDGYLVARFRK